MHWLVRLRHAFCTRPDQIAEVKGTNVGLGIELYFWTLLFLALLMLMAGLINIPSIIHFHSQQYSADRQATVFFVLRGTAICNNQVWVPCPSCSVEGDTVPLSRLATGVVATNGSTIISSSNGNNNNNNTNGTSIGAFVFALKSDCQGVTRQQGFFNFSSLLVILSGMLLLFYYLLPCVRTSFYKRLGAEAAPEFQHIPCSKYPIATRFMFPFMMVVTVAILALIGYLTSLLNNNVSTLGANLFISVINYIFTIVAKRLTDMEGHAISQGFTETSMYMKIALFQLLSTAILWTILSPFDTILNSGGLITTIFHQFSFEVIVTCILQLVVSYYCTSCCSDDFELAERHATITKLVFLTLWYCAIYPSAFFMCACSFLVQFAVDIFILLKASTRPVKVGTAISRASTGFLFMAVLAMAVMSSYFWSAFPFDNLCPSPNISHNTSGTFLVTPLSGDDDNGRAVTVKEGDATYQYCLQDFLRSGRMTFPFVASSQPEDREWMTRDQEIVTNVFGWFSVAGVGIASLIVAILIARMLCGCVLDSSLEVVDHQGRTLNDDDDDDDDANENLEREDELSEDERYLNIERMEREKELIQACRIDQQ